MKKMNFFQLSLFLFIAGMMSVNAQVHIGTIGDNADPHEGAVLDLTNNSSLGLKLPVVALQNDEYLQVGDAVTAALDTDLDAAGMTVYNNNKFALDGVGIYVWDGNRWNGIYAQGKTDGTVIPAPNVCDESIPSMVFAPYNLGANAAKIDSIAAANNISKTKAYIQCSVDDWDAVLGDLYQWGRIEDGHQKRNSTAKALSGATYDANGQVNDVEHIGYFIKNNANPFDWSTTTDNNLWGNGKGITASTDPVGIPYTIDNRRHYYQSTEWRIPDNNPCPAGFRVPTQDEWERITKYDDCNPTEAVSSITMSTSSYDMTTGLTWVRVTDGKVSSASWSTNYHAGWAIYKTSDWNVAGANYKDGSEFLYASGAPEPLLFLPAAGYRGNGNGNVSSIGYYGGYWSSSVNGRNVWYLYFSYNNVCPNNDFRAMGFSVRCAAEY